MALILSIETATEVCSVALSRDNKLLGIRESSARNVHSAMLTTFIDEIIKSSGVSLAMLDAIAVSMGPGSYTGLRIGVATAKGLCYALDKPLIAIPTLQAMAVGMTPPPHPSPSRGGAGGGVTLFCPMIDARRMEVYCAVYDNENQEIREVRAEIIDEFSFQEYLADNVVVFGGVGAAKCKPLLESHPNASFIDDFQASALFMIGLATEKFSQNLFEDLAYFEPFYLKDFVAGKPRVKGLH
ncbi:MAG: tRNA (adenosine(37)-N6)-threonylcarbamoyltransferase complex dimerization subunit type 1 TsaB [Bacteroidales bacterium]|nr:tRNA (adenosine(37)-N6)-threonylcarbamoyltransferase complex dimerization subunit type 1 TsaB [Bacteroidales bacterium]